MRVLYTNKLQSASSLTATTENYNFPLSNILVNQLAMSYKATDITVNITAVFDTAQTVNALGIAGHNANKVVISYYTLSTDVTPAYSETFNSPLGTDVLYPVSHSGKKIVIRLEGTEIISVGSLFIGEYLQMPKPTAYYSEKYVVTNARTDTAFGAVYGSDGEILRKLEPSFSVVDFDSYKSVVSMYSALRNYRTLFVDMNELNHTYKEPLYATLEMSEMNTSRDSRRDKPSATRHSFSLTITEVK